MQLFCLISNDITSYKLADNVYDLTSAQLYFYSLCIKKIQDEINDIKNGTSSSNNPLRITDQDDAQTIREKLDIMKAGMM